MTPCTAECQRALLAACGRRPVYGLAVLMASIGPIPSLEDMRAMVREQSRLAAYRGHGTRARRRAEQAERSA